MDYICPKCGKESDRNCPYEDCAYPSEHYGPAAILTDKTDLSKIDPVKTAEKSLHAALKRLNQLLDDGKIPPDDQDFIFDRICDVLDQLCGWDCAQPYRLGKLHEQT